MVLTHLQAAAGEEHAAAGSPVIAATVLVDPRSAAEFAAGDDENVFVETAVIYVADNAVNGGIVGRQLVAELVEDR
jgi:hypothetical protein